MLVIRLILISFFLPLFASASVVINEIMYDLEGSDSGREWVEIYNNGSSPVDLTGWKFFEANTNHVLTLVQGNINISGNGFAVIVDNAEKFLVDWPNFSGTLFDSSFSFSNTGESLTLRNADLADVDTVTYSSDWGANGDGNSLQKIDGQWKVGSPTPGAQNSASTSDVDVSESPEPTSDVGSQSWPTEPQIYANAGEDRNAIAGADIKFSGRALGLQKEPLENARYLWSFGDG
ncbi:lamin tail domain-containing protein, partial [Patescibacteria group bacterium]|nr:lamin tail domain-containing protein [Patescibacteria group bacterium]